MSEGERIAAAQSAGFTEDDAKRLMEFTDIMCGLTIKQYLLDLLESKKSDTSHSKAAYKRLKRKINMISQRRHVGFQTATIADVDRVEYTLKFIPAVVNADHKQELAVPPMQSQDNTIKGIFQSWDRLIIMLMDYYAAVVKLDGLATDLAEFFPDLDITRMQLRETDRHIFLDPAFGKHVAVLMYYIDSDGNPSKLD